MVPTEDIDACATAHERLLARLRGLDDETARRPSLLPGWSVGHVLTHVARNADSVVRRLAAAVDGELVEQYVGGSEGRAAAIEEGAGRPAAELVEDVRATCEAVDRLCREVPAEVWDREVLVYSGPQRVSTPRLVFTRWREVEIHHVDLGLGYEPEDWPASFVERLLPEVLEGLPERAQPARLLAWGLGRGDAPELSSWG
jgi:maleylpyruvate isomerase